MSSTLSHSLSLLTLSLSLSLFQTLLPPTHASGIPVVVSPNLNVSTNPNITAHLPSCTNLTAATTNRTNNSSNNVVPSPYCYTKLQETAYLTNWNLTSPEVCAPQELWSTCFLRSVYGKPGPNCTTLTNNNATCAQYNCTSLSLRTAFCPQPTTNTTTTIGGGGAENSTSSSAVEYNSGNGTAPQTAEEWYGAFNVYALQNHISTWSAALSANTSAAAILAAVNPRLPTTATTLLTTKLIPTYGLDTSVNADAALIRLLKYPRPEPAFGNSRLRGESSTLSGEQWQVVLRGTLEQTLELVMGRFDLFLEAVEGGAYSARGLASVGNLTRSLRDG